jgi:hypothetical protein
MKASDQTISKEVVNEPESTTIATNSSVSYDKQTIISKESLEETDNINDDYEEEDDDDYNDNEEQKRKELSIQELLGLQSDNNDIDNHYYEDYDDDYE